MRVANKAFKSSKFIFLFFFWDKSFENLELLLSLFILA